MVCSTYGEEKGIYLNTHQKNTDTNNTETAQKCSSFRTGSVLYILFIIQALVTLLAHSFTVYFKAKSRIDNCTKIFVGFGLFNRGSYSLRQVRFKTFLMPLVIKFKINFTITKIEEKNISYLGLGTILPKCSSRFDSPANHSRLNMLNLIMLYFNSPPHTQTHTYKCTHRKTYHCNPPPFKKKICVK